MLQTSVEILSIRDVYSSGRLKRCIKAKGGYSIAHCPFRPPGQQHRRKIPYHNWARLRSTRSNNLSLSAETQSSISQHLPMFMEFLGDSAAVDGTRWLRIWSLTEYAVLAHQNMYADFDTSAWVSFPTTVRISLILYGIYFSLHIAHPLRKGAQISHPISLIFGRGILRNCEEPFQGLAFLALKLWGPRASP